MCDRLCVIEEWLTFLAYEGMHSRNMNRNTNIAVVNEFSV